MYTTNRDNPISQEDPLKKKFTGVLEDYQNWKDERIPGTKKPRA